MQKTAQSKESNVVAFLDPDKDFLQCGQPDRDTPQII